MRPGEELDTPRVDEWLKARIADLYGTPRITQYSGGASNWTYHLEYESHDLVLRRPPAGTKARSAHDMHREFDIQRALRPAYPWVPEMLAFCDDHAVTGSDFYVMRRMPGVILRSRLPKDVTIDAATARALCLSAIDRLIDLHRVDARAVGLDTLGKGAGYVRRQIEGWAGRYETVRTWNVPSFRAVVTWLRANMPDDVGTCVIHNDFRLDNLVLDPADLTRVVGVLDWELATLGDPLMDLGCSMAYWVQASDGRFARALRRQPTDLPGMLTRREVVDYYCGRMGFSPANWVFYEVYGAFRLAGIAQQIYYRYHHKETRNPAFRNFWIWVHWLERRSRKMIANAGKSRGD